MKYHYLYKITNNINGKIYIGRHSTDNLGDEYKGSGVALTRAYKKHGSNNFTKTILAYCETFDCVCNLEAVVVTLDFINRSDTYNMVEGGSFGYGRHSDASKRKMSRFHSGRPRSAKHKAGLAKSIDRPWKHGWTKHKPERLNQYLRLDDLYSLFKTIDHNSIYKFNNLVNNVLGFEVTEAVLLYFNKHGDPKEDSEWIKFMESHHG